MIKSECLDIWQETFIHKRKCLNCGKIGTLSLDSSKINTKGTVCNSCKIVTNYSGKIIGKKFLLKHKVLIKHKV